MSATYTRRRRAAPGPKARRHARTERAPVARPVTRAAPLPSERIAEAIKQGIRDGRFAPGQRLIEADLMAQFSTKRGPVREALRLLAGDGIVEHVPQKGVRVRKLEQEQLAELFPVLAGLMHLTLRLAIPAVSRPPWRRRLEQAMQSLRHAARLKDFAQLQLAAIRYTEVLIAAADNRYLGYLNEKLHPDLFYRQLSSALQIESWDAYLEHLESVHRACLRGDRRAADTLIDEHEQRMEALLRAANAPQ